MSEQFDEQGNDFQTDDVEAHRIPDHVGRDLDVEGHKAGLEPDLAEDTEGHRAAMDKAGWAPDKAGFEVDDDDVEGHKAGLELDEDDVEGHRQIEVDDDVVGKQGLQVQPPRDADNQGNQF